jgi:aspartyl aminopeptidase
MNTYHIIKHETGYGLDKKLNRQGLSTSTVVDTIKGTLEDAGRALLDRLQANELHVDGDTYYANYGQDSKVAAFTVGDDYCECYEYDCTYIIASHNS